MPKLAAAGLCLALSVLLAATHPAVAADDPGDALRRAASAGDLAKVKELLAAGVDVNSANAYGGTALAFATDKGHTAVVELLLERGADPNVKDRFYKSTPLGWAVQKGHAGIVKALLAKGAEGEAEALIGAAGEGNAAIVKVVLERGKMGPETLSEALATASQRQQAEVVALLEAAGAKPPVAVAVDPAILKTYEGAYDAAEGFSVTVTLKEGTLTLAAEGENLTLAALDPVSFRVAEAPGVKIMFQVEEGKVRGMNVDQRGRLMSLKKRETP